MNPPKQKLPGRLLMGVCLLIALIFSPCVNAKTYYAGVDVLIKTGAPASPSGAVGIDAVAVAQKLGWQPIFSGKAIGACPAGGRMVYSDTAATYQWNRKVTALRISKPADNRLAWEQVYIELSRLQVQANAEIIQGAEPSLQVFKDLPDEITPPSGLSALPVSDVVTVPDGFGWSRVWPHGKSAGWHLEKSKTQLEEALTEIVFGIDNHMYSPARVAIVDTHFDTSNPSLKGITFVSGKPFQVPDSTGFFGGPSHGTGTLSILAGQTVKVKRLANQLPELVHGANPHALIIAIEGANGVAQLWGTESVAEGLSLAADEQADVVSLSNGGWPSGIVRDAANKCYTNGTAIFAATGDWFDIPFFPISSPRYVVYPAAYDCCVAVAGVTEKSESYAKSPSWFGWVFHWSEWSARGSAGPSWLMDRAVASYSPNVVWAHMAPPENVIDLYGSGTSASTPQVAGAASLWYEKYRIPVNQIVGSLVQDKWKKAELIYQAILKSADKTQAEESQYYLGNGVLKAKNALNTPPNASWLPDKPKLGRPSLNVIGILSSIIHPPTSGIMGVDTATAADQSQTKFDIAVQNAFNLPKMAVDDVVAQTHRKAVIRSFQIAVNFEAEQKLARTIQGAAFLSVYQRLPQFMDDRALIKEFARIGPSRAKKLLAYLRESDCSGQLNQIAQAVLEK